MSAISDSHNSLSVLAQLVLNPPEDILQPAAREIAGMALVDLLGVSIAGMPEEVSGIARTFVSKAGTVTGEGARVFGTDIRVSSADAAFANATTGHALDFDDSSFVLGGHPSVVIYPALLSLSEARNYSPNDVIEAYLVGLEVLSRIARAVNFHHYEKGWHPTTTIGVFGSAAGAARLLGLGTTQTAHALGLAAAMSCGFKASFGTMAKPLQVGQACRSGLSAALLAEAGATSSITALDAANGFFELFNGAGNYDTKALSRPSGNGIPDLKFKLYPSCGATHVVVDAARELRQAHGFLAEEIETVDLWINPRRLPHVDRPSVDNALAGKFSVQFTAAAALCDGQLGVDHFTPQAISRPDITAVSACIRAHPFAEDIDGLNQPCRMVVTLKDDRVLEIRLEGPSGRDPVEYRDNMQDKFMTCTGRVMPDSDAKNLFDLARNFEKLGDVRQLTDQITSLSGYSIVTPQWSKDIAHV